MPHAGHGATFDQSVSHRGDDFIGKRNLRIGRRPATNLGSLRWVSDLGFEGIELMLDVRERFLQISQFLRAGIDP